MSIAHLTQLSKLGTALAIIFFCAGSVQASDSRCPPGMTSPDGNVCVPGNSMYDEVNAIMNRPPNFLPAEDPELAKMQARTNEGASAVVAAAELFQDPEYQLYLTGKWKFLPGPGGKNNGEYCSAFFSREGTIVNLTGPGGDYRGAMLIFLSADIPRPEKQQTLEIVLTQNDEPPVTTTALNFSSPGHSFGSLALLVPSMEALLEGMEDVISFRLEAEGKPIASVRWHSGLLARSEIKRCMSGQPYSVSQLDILGN